MHGLTGILLLAALATLPRPTAGQRDRAPDNNRMGLFVYNLMLFVRWPAEAFQNRSEALRVQIIGRDPFDGRLGRILGDKTVDHRRIVVTYSAIPTTRPLPHVVFVSAAEEPR